MDQYDTIGIENISIHALREEGDPLYSRSFSFWANFYPRPPRGGRRCAKQSAYSSIIFLSTPSARRATAYVRFLLAKHYISIHALREEGDV